MASKTDICNQALLRLGQPAIMEGSDDSVTARRVTQEFDAALGAILRIHPWPFAIARKELNRSTTTPVFGFAYYYMLPSDIARLIEVDTGSNAYQIEGTFIATNSAYVKIRYISKIQAMENMDDAVANTLSLYLASVLAIIITENQSLKSQLYEEYSVSLASARNIWSVEDYPQTMEESSWVVSRTNGGGPQHHEIFNPWGADGLGVKR